MNTRILIVDDDPLICRQLEELFGSHQYEAQSTSNAADALRLLAEQEYSLVVCDLKIPGTDGIGLTREIMGERMFPLTLAGLDRRIRELQKAGTGVSA